MLICISMHMYETLRRGAKMANANTRRGANSEEASGCRRNRIPKEPDTEGTGSELGGSSDGSNSGLQGYLEGAKA